MAAMTLGFRMSLPDTTVVLAGLSATAPSARTLTTSATALARAPRLACSCWRRLSFSTTNVTTETMPTASRNTRTKASVRRPWKVRGRTRESGTDKPARSAGACPLVAGTGTGATARDFFLLDAVEPGFLRFRPGATSAFREGVPGSADRQHEPRARGIVLELLSQVADVDVDRLLVLVQGLVVADQLQQLAAGVDTARLAGEVAQDLELRGGQCDAPVAAPGAPPLEVDQQVAVAQQPAAARIREIAVGSAQQRLDPAHQLAQPERLGHVVVGAEFQTDDLVHLLVARGQD